MNNKIFLSIGLLIVALGILGFLYTRNAVIAPTLPSANTPSQTTATTSAQVTSPLVYTNTAYQFTISLPESWRGYALATSTWNGVTTSDSRGERVVASGPIILIRHPLWTKANHRQDIPVMVFTISQWNELQADRYHIGAAPIGPTKLGSNSRYVFALPARYNFAFLPGYEEVDRIIQSNSFKAL